MSDVEKNRVRKIQIKGLFGQYDHVITLSAEDRVTILHGRNGVGKTVTLTLVASVLHGNYLQLMQYPFLELRLDFEDGAYIIATPAIPQTGKEHELVASTRKSPRTKSKGKPGQLSVHFGEPGAKQETVLIEPNTLLKAVSQFARKAPWLTQLSDDEWIDRRSDDVVSAEDLLRLYGESMNVEKRHESEKLRRLRTRVPVHFIEAQRLLRIRSNRHYYGPSTKGVTSAVVDIAEEMARKIKDTDSKYRATSTELDDTFPTRVFSAPKSHKEVSREQMANRAGTLKENRERLRNIGLIADSGEPLNPDELDDAQRAIFAVYLDDNEKKLQVFEELAGRAEILLDIINHKFAPKRVQLDKDTGYVVYGHDSSRLELSVLSSGEQHELVLLHNLLFRVEPGSLLLIDEPELSLHVTWQSEFLQDLIRIAKTVGFDAICATHSPYIVGDRTDLMQRLGEPV